MHAPHLERLLSILEGPEGSLDLAEAALLVANEEYATLDIEHYLEWISVAARTISKRLAPDAAVGDALFSLNEYFFDELGFSAVEGPLSDPRAVLLNDVLESRKGAAVTLSVLYMAIGRQLGLPLYAVIVPGRLLVKVGADGEAVVEPGNGGLLLGEQELRLLLARYSRKYREDMPAAALGNLLIPAHKREVLLRMAKTLKSTFLQRNLPEKALWVVDLMLRIDPELVTERRDRGLLYERLQYMRGATGDYRRYLELAPDAADRTKVWARLKRLEKKDFPLH